MSVLAIVGAGPGVGGAVARRFGREGYAVALVARDRGNLDALGAALADDGVHARGFAADVLDPDGLASALGAAADALGPVTALQYSPLPSRTYLRPVLETSADDVIEAVRFSVIGALTAVHAVLPGMRAAGGGSIVFLNGGTSVRPVVKFAGTSIAFAGESALARMLHDELEPEGIRVAQLVIPGGIVKDDLERGPAAIAERVWKLVSLPGPFRAYASPMNGDLD